MRPLCVDLDGTLIKTDLLLESFCLLLKEKPLLSLCAPFWLLRGKAHLKRRIAENVRVAPELLPYREDLLNYLRDEQAGGKSIVLVTASDELLVRPVADYLGVFSEVLASNGKVNCRGTVKAEILKARFGPAGFDYAGNSCVDLPVWKQCAEPLVVGEKGGLFRRVRAENPSARLFEEKRYPLFNFIRGMRMHQWVKNLLLFVPIIMAHRLGDLQTLWATLLGFVAFGIAASSVYLFNDLLDLESDRRHPHKKFRPVASGDFSIAYAAPAVLILLLLALVMSLYLPRQFLAAVAVYWGVTLAYSLYFKHVVMLDIIILASLYALRVLAGGYAGEVAVSHWLLAFSMFFFFSLACIKRYSELVMLRNNSDENSRARGYFVSDFEQIAQFGSASAFVSVLVMALYISSAEVAALYRQPQFLWLVCPALFYWVTRIWLLAHRGQLHHDPIVFAMKDKVSYLTGAICLGVIWLAL